MLKGTGAYGLDTPESSLLMKGVERVYKYGKIRYKDKNYDTSQPTRHRKPHFITNEPD